MWDVGGERCIACRISACRAWAGYYHEACGCSVVRVLGHLVVGKVKGGVEEFPVGGRAKKGNAEHVGARPGNRSL